MNQQTRFTCAADLLDRWRDDVWSGRPPKLFPIGDGELLRIEIGPGLVSLFGGAPGAGKTAFVMQATVDALRLKPDLRALICNVEMAPAVLLDRQLARLSGVDATSIRYRLLTAEHTARIELGMDTLAGVADRLCFLLPPFNLADVATAADVFGAELLVLDYLQRIHPPGDHGEARHGINATMQYLRSFADLDVAVLVVSALGRSRDSRGRASYTEGLSLASYRESSELEFGCDDAFILQPGDDDLVKLRHLKSRHGECRDIELHFDGSHQCFTPTASVPRDAMQRKIAAAWESTPPAPEDDDR